jgi:plasmid stability protein
MRTTLTLDEDVAVKLKAEARRSGRSFKATVNDTLRRAFANAPKAPRKAPFKVQVRDLGHLRPGLSLDNVADLIEQVEGPLHR